MILTKSQIAFMLLFSCIAIPVLSGRMDAGGIGDGLIFFMVLFVLVMLLPNTVSMAETADERVTAYLCATPYSRKQMVLSKYIFDICIVVVYFFIYTLESMVFQDVGRVGGLTASVLIAVIFLYRGAYIPLEYKVGYEKAKYIGMASIMLLPFLLPTLLNNIDIEKLDFSVITALPVWLKYVMVYGGILLWLTVSYMLSERIFEKKEL